MRTDRGWCPVLPEPGRARMVRSLYEFEPEAILPRLPMPTLIGVASDSSDGVAPEVLSWWRSQGDTAAQLCPHGRFRTYVSRHNFPLIKPAELAADLG